VQRRTINTEFWPVDVGSPQSGGLS